MWSLLIGWGSMGLAEIPEGHPLETRWGFSREEVRAIEKGKPVAKIVRNGDGGEVSVMGAIRLSVTKEAYVSWYQKVENFKISPVVVEVARIGVPPAPGDLAGFKFDGGELRTILGCTPEHCGLKLLQREIEVFQEKLDPSQADFEEQSQATARRMLIDYLSAYAAKGNAALGTYGDQKRRVDLAETFRTLADRFTKIKEMYPGPYRAVRDYAGAIGGKQEEFLYWSRERYGYGLKPVVSFFHVMIFRPDAATLVLASKQIRASHYYDGSLGFTVVMDAPEGCYLVYFNRSNIDLLRGTLGGWKRWLFESRLPGEIRKQFVLIQQSVGRKPATATGPE